MHSVALALQPGNIHTSPLACVQRDACHLWRKARTQRDACAGRQGGSQRLSEAPMLGEAFTLGGKLILSEALMLGETFTLGGRLMLVEAFIL